MGLCRSAPLEVSAADSDALEYCVYTTFAETRELKAGWNDLAARTGDVLCSYDWCELWWKHFGRWRRLEIHTLHDRGRLVAVLPLFRETIRPGGVPLRTVRVLGCDYTITTVGLAVEPAWAERFTQMLLDRLGCSEPWDILQIGPLRTYATVCEQMAQACAGHADIQGVIHGRRDNWGTLIHLPGTFEEYMASLANRVRSDARRCERQLHERHKVEVVTVKTRDQIRPALDALIDLHQKRWVEKGQPGQFGGFEGIERFHRELAERLVDVGQLVLMVLKLDDQPVAATYGYRFGPRTHNLFVGHLHDEKWQRYSPGRIMYFHLIQHAMAHGADVLEDGRGVFEHKLRLGGKLYGERSLVAVRRGWSSRLRFWLALRMAYGIHVVCSRLWIDMLAPRLGITPKARHFHQRNWMLAQLMRRVRFPLFGGPKVHEAQSVEPVASEHLGPPVPSTAEKSAAAGRAPAIGS